MFAINIDLNEGASSFYMYDWEDKTKNLEIVEDTVFDTSTVYFTQDGDDNWHASLKEGDNLLLGETLDFGFYFSDSNEIYESYELIEIEAGKDYKLTQADMTVIVHDAAPVPIPETALLLTSGIFALVAIRRVRQ